LQGEHPVPVIEDVIRSRTPRMKKGRPDGLPSGNR